jgi:hypothetical protein
MDAIYNTVLIYQRFLAAKAAKAEQLLNLSTRLLQKMLYYLYKELSVVRRSLHELFKSHFLVALSKSPRRE